jgi:hypothetical protein
MSVKVARVLFYVEKFRLQLIVMNDDVNLENSYLFMLSFHFRLVSKTYTFKAEVA